jgi:hypothetical protein
MERALAAMLEDMERSGPEGVGAPMRAVAILASELVEVVPATLDPLSRRRRRASAARLARRALSLGTEVHGVIADRPDTARAWWWNSRELERRVQRVDGLGDGEACSRALGRVASLVLELPPLPDDPDWQVGLIAFADEAMLSELHDACLELAVAALVHAASA